MLSNISNISNISNKILIFNGLYDIYCAISILYFPNNLFGRIHPNIFNSKSLFLEEFWHIGY